MRPRFGAWFLLVLAAPGAAQGAPVPENAEALLFGSLAPSAEEREECLALALRVAMRGDCEGALEWLAAAAGTSPGEDEFARRLALERGRLEAWIELRDATLAEFAKDGKALALEIGGKKVASHFTREGDELLLARGPVKRVGVRSLAPELLLPSIPKERFEGTKEWLKIYPYCVTGNAKWKRLTTSDSSSESLKQDAQDFYPRARALGAVVEAIDALARCTPPPDAGEARARMAEIEGLLVLGREEPCVARRLELLGALAERLLTRASSALEITDFVHAKISSPATDVLRLAYDFSTPEQALDWINDDGYLAELRGQLDPVKPGDESTRFAPGPKGFSGNGEVCWRHAIEFQAPVRVSYRVRWEPTGGQSKPVFAFALGLLGDARERHVRCAELGFLYVDERDGRYLAKRPNGDAVVQLGQTYAIELVHDGRKSQVWVDGVLRTEGEAKDRQEGFVFLWCHSDLLVGVPGLEVEGRITPATLVQLRAQWVRNALARLQLVSNR